MNAFSKYEGIANARVEYPVLLVMRIDLLPSARLLMARVTNIAIAAAQSYWLHKPLGLVHRRQIHQPFAAILQRNRQNTTKQHQLPRLLLLNRVAPYKYYTR